MKEKTFPLLILLLTAYFFGALAFTVVSALILLPFLYFHRKWSYALALLFAPTAFFFMPIAIGTIILFTVLEEEDNFYRISYIIGASFMIFIVFPVLNLLLYTSPDVLTDYALLHSIGISFLAATSATLIALFFALPLGYILARRDFAAKGVIESIIDMPVVIPHTVAGITLLLVFGTSGLWGAPLKEWGLRFYYAFPGIVVAMLFVSAPFLINQVREGIAKIDERYEYTAMSLGASRFRVFTDILLPQIKGNILSGSINTWARAVSEFGAVIMIAFYPMIAPTYIYYLYTNYGLREALPATAFLLLLTLAIFIGMRSIGRRMRNA